MKLHFWWYWRVTLWMALAEGFNTWSGGLADSIAWAWGVYCEEHELWYVDITCVALYLWRLELAMVLLWKFRAMLTPPAVDEFVDKVYGDESEVVAEELVLDTPVQIVPDLADGSKSTDPLEVRGHRIVRERDRAAYVRKVLDEVKNKFGTPKDTEANHKAVWNFAHNIMKRHGVRPSHIRTMLPYVSALAFEPSDEERRAKKMVGSWKHLSDNSYQEYLGRLAKWTRHRSMETW